jgi:hypothetical protein
MATLAEVIPIAMEEAQAVARRSKSAAQPTPFLSP